MERVDDALLRRMTAIIVDTVDPEQVFLFGSRARGDAEADSDVDLVIVEAQAFGPGRDRGAERHASGARSRSSTFQRIS